MLVFTHPFACLSTCSAFRNLEHKCVKHHMLDLCDVCWAQSLLILPFGDLCRKRGTFQKRSSMNLLKLYFVLRNSRRSFEIEIAYTTRCEL